AEIEKCAWNCEFYAENAEHFLADEHIKTTAQDSYVAYEPLGVVLAIMPWNFPFWQVIRFAAPALMAGNGAVLKHASNVPQCALAVEQVFDVAGFPNTGPSSICAKRFIVEEAVADEFERRFKEEAAKLTVGDPLERDNKLGPLARGDLLDALERQVDESVKQGAKVVLGGQRKAGRGYF